jgi:hypothetical protein
MEKHGYFKPISVVTKSYQLLYNKTYKLSNIPRIRLEGKRTPLIAFKYPSDKCAKLEEVLQKLGIAPLKKGEATSKKYQLLMDLLIEHSSEVAIEKLSPDEEQVRFSNYIEKPVQVEASSLAHSLPLPRPEQAQKPQGERYCQHGGMWVRLEACDRCRVASPQVWFDCPEILKQAREKPFGAEIR